MILQAGSKLSEILSRPGSAICRDPNQEEPRWLVFHSPEKTLAAYSPNEVEKLTKALHDEACAGRWAAGFISYEAAPTFDDAMEVAPPPAKFPLACFAIYKEPAAVFDPQGFSGADYGKAPDFVPETSKEDYCGKLREVLRSVDRGETYQIDLTLRLRAERAEETPWEIFYRLAAAHPAPYMGCFNMGGVQLCSMSPELFLARKGTRIETEPMKGTARRAADPIEDAKLAKWLANDEKNRAENLMIVDMCRNDLGRICLPGSVKVPELFKVASYPTVHQMTSRVEGVLPRLCGLPEILKASFPPASITGAPKIMAMKRIAELERSPRKAYTGCAGCLAPGGDFLFSVAIRTIVFDGEGVELGVGGGIVADSEPESEWEECMAKAAFASSRAEGFKTLETLLWTRGKGFHLPDGHAARAKRCQLAFGRVWKEGAFEATLAELDLESSNASFARVRVLMDARGVCEAGWTPLDSASWGAGPIKALLSACRTDASDMLLRHKTTARRFYDLKFKESHAHGFTETIFLNGRGELTEGAISNIIVEGADGRLRTPSASCGLLEGLWRAESIRLEGVEEATLTIDDLKDAASIRIGNSVRGGVELDELWAEEADGSARLAPIYRKPA